MPTPMNPRRMSTSNTSILVVDVQEKLLPKIHDAASVERNIAFLLDACKLLAVPASATEQYPKGLGATVPELARRLPNPLPEKRAFSSCAAPGVVEGFQSAGRT